jgi:hypothetical protein
MKCYKHPVEEAIGNCSSCGKAICKICTEIKAGRLLCKECLQIEISPSKVSLYNWIGALSGWLGAINSFTMGFYLITTYYAIMGFPGAENLGYSTYVATVLTATLAFLLVYGSYLLWKGDTRKGGTINLIVGAMLIPIYIYFTFFSQPSLLKWLGPLGVFLCAPAILSGAIGILITK